MSIRASFDPACGVLTIEVSGRFDYSCQKDFRACWEGVDSPPGGYAIDLAQTGFIDSSALGALLVLRERADQHQLPVRLVHVTPGVRELLEIANFQQIFEIVMEQP